MALRLSEGLGLTGAVTMDLPLGAHPFSIWILMGSCVSTSDDPCTVRIVVCTGMFAATNPLSIGVLVCAGVSAAANPCSIGILVGTCMRTATNPCSVRILVRSGVGAAANPGAIGILMSAGVALVGELVWHDFPLGLTTGRGRRWLRRQISRVGNSAWGGAKRVVCEA